MGRSTRYVSITSCCEVKVWYNRLVGVPIFNIDKRPFAMLCAYNSSEHGRRYVSIAFQFHEGCLLMRTFQLEGHELSYLRAIGMSSLTPQKASMQFTYGCFFRCGNSICCAQKTDDTCRQSKELVHFQVSYEIHLPRHWPCFDSSWLVSLTSYALLYMAYWQPPSCFLTRN